MGGTDRRAVTTMPEWEPRDLVELRIRGEFIDVVGLLSHVSVEVVDIESDKTGIRAEKVVRDLVDQTQDQVNFGLAERQLKRLVSSGEVPEYRGIDVRAHEFDPRHPDVESELDVNNLPDLADANAYYVVMKSDESYHMAGYPDSLDPEIALELASLMRSSARAIEDRFLTMDVNV